MGMPGLGVWRRGIPWSNFNGESVWMVMPVWLSSLRRAWWIGAGPRRLAMVLEAIQYERNDAYCGRIEGWTLRPPYLAASMRRGGTKSPNETAMIRLMGSPSGVGIS
jgi:hypothetical protein